MQLCADSCAFNLKARQSFVIQIIPEGANRETLWKWERKYLTIHI